MCLSPIPRESIAMEKRIKPLVDFLRETGIENVSHTNKTYMSHLVGLYRLLEERGLSEDVCRGGMFHSIYGTELFQGFKLPVERRADVRALIGERAEWLAYLNCAMDRTSFDAAVARGTAPYRFVDRLTGAVVELTVEDFDDLGRIHLYDWLEQVGRSQDWDYRRDAYRRLAERFGGPELSLHNKVFGGELVL
jgi:hypothetical protein